MIEGDKFKTVFRTSYRQFKYRLMPFGLNNTPAMFLAHIDECSRPDIDYFAGCYLHEIVKYLANEHEHEDHV